MKRFLTQLYLYSFFDDLVFIYPLYSVMFVDYGLSALQISIMLIVWSGTSFLLNVPAGVIADKYSRKHILFFAQIVRILGYACWIIYPHFWGFLLGFVLWGIKSAFTSGTFEALLYDELRSSNQQAEFTKLNGRMKSIHYVAIIVTGLGASLAAYLQFGYSVILAVGIVSLAASSLAIILLPSAKKTEESKEKKEYFTLLKEGLGTSLTQGIILKTIIFIALSQALFGALDEYFPIFANQAGLLKSQLGLFAVVYGAVQALASFISHRFQKYSQNTLYLFFIVNGVLLVAASLLFNVPSLLLLFLFTFIFKGIDVITEGKLHHSIESDHIRATIASVKDFFVEVAVTGLYLAFGLIAKSNDYRSGFLTVGWFVVGIGLIMILFLRQRKTTEKSASRLAHQLGK